MKFLEIHVNRFFNYKIIIYKIIKKKKMEMIKRVEMIKIMKLLQVQTIKN